MCNLYDFKQLNVMDMRWGHPVCALDIGCDQGINTLFLDFR